MSEISLPSLGSLPSRLLRLYGGLALYGLGIGLQVESALGNDPWDVFHEGLAVRTGLSIGTWIILVGALVMVLWIPLRQKPGIGTISNIIFLGLFADAAMYLLPAPGTGRWRGPTSWRPSSRSRWPPSSTSARAWAPARATAS